MPHNPLLPSNQVTLPLAEIQGDVLIGLKKNAEVFVFFTINDVVRFRQELDTVFADITFSDQMKAVEDAKNAGQALPLFLGFNIAFTASGLAKLKPLDDLTTLDDAFRAGAVSRRGLLGDQAPWLPEYDQAIDGALLVTGVDAATARNQADAIESALRHSISVVRREHGLVRTGDQKGHEHLGFEDGISQPGVEGLTAPGPKPGQGLPGQDLIKPGEFLLGHENEEGQVSAPPLAWMVNGSYLVFRRLNQDVPAFHAYMAANFAAAGMTSADQLGAHLVGRWASGAPTVMTPFVDNLALAADKMQNNDFEFGAEDPHQQRCPFVAHIRKMYPREDFDPPLEGEPDRRRILRAGIPFGRDEDADKGLLFACYQNSIVDKFEFIQASWANNPGFMFGKTTCAGADIVPGRDITIGQGGARTASVGDPQHILPDAPAFVTATGAVYLFTPSRTALREMIDG
jgi:Dyp-type peroxidase family